MSNSTVLTKRKYFNPADLLVIGLVLLTVVVSVICLYSHKGEGRTLAEVKVRGEVVETIDLTEVKAPYELSVEGAAVKLLVSSEGIRFLHSDCPDKLCINRGVISQSGESAVCLPAGVSVKITQDTEKSGIDAIAG